MSEAEYGAMSRGGRPRTLRTRAIVSTLVLTIPTLIADPIGGRVAAETMSSTSVPASCGPIGASAYEPEPVEIPQVDVSPRGRIITVSNNSDTINGDTSSVEALAANPGPDGTSLREAIEATNRDPGTSTINFSPSLNGATIAMSEQLHLEGGNVLINGDIDADGLPDVTLDGTSSEDWNTGEAFRIKSSGNTLHAMTLNGFFRGVNLLSTGSDGLYTNNVMSNLEMTAVREYGIKLSDPGERNHWVDTLIVGNTIEVDHSLAPQRYFGGVHFPISAGSSLERTTIANNTIRIARGGVPEPPYVAGNEGSQAILLTTGNNSQAEIADTLIAYNTIEMVDNAGLDGDFGIEVRAGGSGGNYSVVDGLRIVDNEIQMATPGSSTGIQLMASAEQTGSYAEGNVMKNVSILGNTIEGPGARAIDIGKAVGKDNRVLDVSILGNTISIGPAFGLHHAIYLSAGAWFGSQPVGDNELSGVVVKQNTMRLVKPSPHSRAFYNAAVKIFGSLSGTSNRVTNISVTHNFIDGAGGTGVNVLGAVSSTSNRISEISISCNRLKGGRRGDVTTAAIALVGAHGDPEQLGAHGDTGSGDALDNVVGNVRVTRNSIKSPSVGIRLIGGIRAPARRNRVTCVTQRGNRIDAPKKISVRANVAGATGNKARLAC